MSEIAARPPVMPIQHFAFSESGSPADTTASSGPTSTGEPVRRRRFERLRTPVVGLFLLAPLVGEFLLGDLPLIALPAILLLAPMYGGGALLIRETARRRGMGWPGILLLALAYGVLEEGVVTQSLFNPDYVGEHLLEPAYVSWLGTGLVWAFYVVGLHVLGSIGAPIALVEAMTPGRRRTPWLGRRGLIVTAVLFVLGCLIGFATNFAMGRYFAPWYRIAEALAVTIVLVLVALALPSRRAEASRSGLAPRPGVVGVVAFLLVSAALAAPLLVDALTAWGTVALQVAVVLLGAVLLIGWGGRSGWGERSVLAVAVAVLAGYAWQAYQHAGFSTYGVVVIVGDLVLDYAMLRLALAAFRRNPASPRVEADGAAARPAS